MSNESFAGLLSKLANNDPGIQSLNLSDFDLTDSNAVELFAALSSNTTLTSLDLSENPITSVSLAAATPVLTLRNVSLRHLDLSCTNIGDIGAQTLAKILLVNTSLCSLELRDTGISERGSIALACALRYNQTLATLDLQGNAANNFPVM